MRKRLAWFVALALMVLLATGGVATAKQTTVTLTARLSGAQEVPAADPDGSGKAFVMIDVEAGEVCFDIKSLSDVGTPNRGHIHVGGTGVNGDIVVPFFELRIPPTTPGSAPTDPRNEALESGRLMDCVPGDPVILARIVANPAGFYVNVHNARFPGGALRCQLEA
jgi:CHRD domain-containing protein